MDLAAARQAIERLAGTLGLEPIKVALGDPSRHRQRDHMASAAAVHHRERRARPSRLRTPRTGGAGPVHAQEVDRKIGILRVICPPSAGVASALGLLVAPARVDRVATVGVRLDTRRLASLETAFGRLEDEARAVMADTGLKLESATMKRLADGRFLGQGFNLVVDLPEGPYDDSAQSRKKLTAAFESAYREKFSLTPPGVAVEFLNIRVSARAPVSGSEVVLQGRKGTGAAGALKGKRPAYFSEAGGFVETAVYERSPSRPAFGARAFKAPPFLEDGMLTRVAGPVPTAASAPTVNCSSRPRAPFRPLSKRSALEGAVDAAHLVVASGPRPSCESAFLRALHGPTTSACVLTHARGLPVAPPLWIVPILQLSQRTLPPRPSLTRLVRCRAGHEAGRCLHHQRPLAGHGPHRTSVS